MPVVLALVVSLVLDPDQAYLGPPERAPLRDPPDAAPLTLDAPEEVRRREEDQVPAAVAVARDQVVRMARDVLVVAGEDDQVVELRQRRRARKPLEVVVGEEIDLLPGPVQPA